MKKEIRKTLERIKVSDLIPYKRNPRKIPPEAVEIVKKSYRQCGVIDPIEIDEKNIILSGHTRRLAAIEMGLEEVDALRVTGLTEQQKRKYRILANKTGEKSGWDYEILVEETADLDFEDIDDFDFSQVEEMDWFERDEKDGAKRQAGNEEYNQFLDKFEAKKTTDDCYTPELIYDAVKEWVLSEYQFPKESIVRPFYPGGDYEKENYKDGCVVLDNPPFSLLANIIRFYDDNHIKFFLFAPAMTLFSAHDRRVTYIGTGASITYENGAVVSTSFITNLDNCRARTAPDLCEAITEANRKIHKEMHGEQAKYDYPSEVLTATMLSYWSKYGVDFRLDFNDCTRISALDEQKKEGKAIFGGGFLLAQAAAAQAAAAQAWELSDRERALSESLGRS